jgi:hypothetical protein
MLYQFGDPASDVFSVISTIVSILLLVAFFTMAANLGRIRRIAERYIARGGQTRDCPHCHEEIQRLAEVCPFCQRESNPWVLRDGYWWIKGEGGQWFYLDPRGNWIQAQQGQTPEPTPDSPRETLGGS